MLPYNEILFQQLFIVSSVWCCSLSQRQGIAWTSHQVRASTERQTLAPTFHTYKQFKVASQCDVHVFGLQWEALALGENPDTGQTCKLNTGLNPQSP